MDGITGIAGLPVTAARLTQAQARFDEAAEAVTAAADPAGDPAASDLAGATAGLMEERLLNQVLIGVFRAQAQQQADLVGLLDRSAAR